LKSDLFLAIKLKNRMMVKCDTHAVWMRSIFSGPFIHALIICFFSSLLTGQNLLDEKEISLFDGETLNGWVVMNPEHKDFWKVKDGVILCGNGQDKIPVNLFLYTDKIYQDFEFRCLFRLTGDPATGMINSGIQYRSHVKDSEMVGYQADIGDGYWGDLYDEHRRGQLVTGKIDVLDKILHKNGWNSYVIRCTGDLHELYINGVKTCEYAEKDSTIPNEGVIALQLHSGVKRSLNTPIFSLKSFNKIIPL